jgi:8-oxo-dGTP pyrophosphatase MutT (NUDIX family)
MSSIIDNPGSAGPVTPSDAATIVVVREVAAGLEVFCVQRNAKASFMAGAVVFPGGKLDASDGAPEWEPLCTASPALRPGFVTDEVHLRALAVAACRETLEEAGLLLSSGTLGAAEVAALRKALAADPGALRAFLSERGLRLDLGALHPLAHWVTPEVEKRRFDTRFFLAVAPSGQEGAHDQTETTASFWASPAEVLRRFEAGEVQLMPPTHRTLLLLSGCADLAAAVALAAGSSLQPICPRLAQHKDAQGQTLALVLPGDPEHPVAEVRVAGPSRYVLRGDRWLATSAP